MAGAGLTNDDSRGCAAFSDTASEAIGSPNCHVELEVQSGFERLDQTLGRSGWRYLKQVMKDDSETSAAGNYGTHPKATRYLYLPSR